MISLGAKVTDSITGFKGVATGRAEYLHNGASIRITACELNAGKPMEEWFDEQRIVVTERPAAGFGGQA